MSRRIPLSWTLLGLVVAIAPLGCTVEEYQPGGYIPIAGRVTFRGQPVKKGTINFLPEREGAVPASGEIHQGDIRNVTTRRPGDGLMEGRYKVTIIAFEQDGTPQRPDRFNGPSPEEVAALAASTEVLIPLKYSTVHESDLVADVSPDKRTFEFELKDN